MAAGRLKIDIRRKKILELLAQNGQVTVTELSELLNATQTTIRTDLDTMAAENRLMRIPGGAIAVPAQPVQPPVQEAAPDTLAAQKRAIAAKTLSHIQDGDTLFLNSGSTTLRVAEALCVRKRLCVVTNSIRAAEVWQGTRKRMSCCWAARSTRSMALRLATTPCSSWGAISPHGRFCL